MDKAELAADCFNEALTLARAVGDRACEGSALNSLGLAYTTQGDSQRVIGCYEQKLVIDRETGDRKEECKVLGYIGNAYFTLGNTQRAFEYYDQQLVIAREIGDLNSMANISYNRALLYSQQGETSRALPFAQEAVKIFSQMGSPDVNGAKILVAQLQGDVPDDPAQAAAEAFKRAENFQDLQKMAEQHPLLKDDEYIQVLEQAIIEQVPPGLRAPFKQRLIWLKQIAGKQETGFWGRLFGKK
jgi:tetratricopeptide (TPR) repeat protein